MTDTDRQNPESEGVSTKTVVRIMIALAIGIPVVLELFTLFNLVNVRLFGGEEESSPQVEQLAPVQEFAKGDTLFATSPASFVIDEMRIYVRPQHWRFELMLAQADSIQQEDMAITIDSLNLSNGTKIRSPHKLQFEDSSHRWETSWRLPSEHKPTRLFISSMQAISKDSTQRVGQGIRVGQLSIRYDNESD